MEGWQTGSSTIIKTCDELDLIMFDPFGNRGHYDWFIYDNDLKKKVWSVEKYDWGKDKDAPIKFFDLFCKGQI